MKSITLTCLILVISVVGVWGLSPELQKNVETCQKENGAKNEDMVNIRMGKMNAADVKDNMKCTLKCFLVKGGFMDETGKFNVDAMKNGLPVKDKKAFSDAVDKCKDKKGANPCETAYQMVTCLVENKAELTA